MVMELQPEQSHEQELLKRLQWPYKYSSDSALLPEFSMPANTAAVIT